MKKIEFDLKEINDLKLIPVDFKSPAECESGKSGIYFLLNENKEVIYLGQSQNIRGRLQSHLSKNTESRWNPYTDKPVRPTTKVPLGSVYYVTWIYLEDDEYYKLRVLEALYFEMYKPFFNFNYRNMEEAIEYIKTHELKDPKIKNGG